MYGTITVCIINEPVQLQLLKRKTLRFAYKCSVCVSRVIRCMSWRYWNSSQLRCNTAATSGAVALEMRPRSSAKDCDIGTADVMYGETREEAEWWQVWWGLGGQGVGPPCPIKLSGSYSFRNSLMSKWHWGWCPILLEEWMARKVLQLGP
jgi:hypothetical protein